MKKYIEIVADTNDADYISSRTLVTDEEIEKIMPVIKAIKNFKPENKYDRHNYPDSKYCDDNVEEIYGDIDGFDEFQEMVPYSEHGIHTITSIKLLIVTEETKLL